MIGNRVTFEHHVKNFFKKEGEKLHALPKIANYMDINKKRSIMNVFTLSQFSYCPLIWMFQSRKLNHRINKIHERTLKIVYNDHQCIFEELLERDTSFTIHEQNLQKLAIEMFRVNNGLSVQLVKIFILQKIIILNINQEQNLMLMMLKLKHIANKLYHISDQKSGIPYRKK